MIKGIARELLESFNLFEADNEDGTDNDDGEKVLPSDVQHGFKSKIKSKNIINPVLQELEIKNNFIEPIEKDSDNYIFETTINDQKILVEIFKETQDGEECWEIIFKVGRQLSLNKSVNKDIFKIYEFVLNCIFSFLHLEKPTDNIIFYGFSAEQDRIYEYLLNSGKSKINSMGYNITKKQRKDGFKVFYLEPIKENLNELEIKNNFIDPSSKNEGYYSYKNIINGKNIVVGFSQENKNLWEMGFHVDYRMSLNKELDKDIFKIYRFVIDAIFSFLTQESPKELRFHGFSSEQDSIYDFFVKSSKKQLNDIGYTISKVKNLDDYEEFSLTRKENLNELSIPDSNIKPSKEENSGSNIFVYYETEIDNNFVKLVLNLDNDDYASVAFTVNKTMQIEKDKKINPMKIYNYVISCLYSFIKDYSPKGLYFMPYSNQHKENYDILGKLLQKDLQSKGYSITFDEFTELYTINKNNDLEEMKKLAGF